MDTKEKIEVMRAFLDGKKIQVQGNFSDGEWEDWCIKETPSWDWALNNYRIKPEEKKATYRPYKNTDEMIEDFKERFSAKTECKIPLIWIRAKETEYMTLCVRYLKKDVSTHNRTWNMNEFFKEFTYLDGSPCGKLVEE